MAKLTAAIIVALATLVPSNAAADTIIFDTCEPASECLGTQFRMSTFRLDGQVRVQITANPRAYGEGALGFNLVDIPGVTIEGLSPGFTLASSGSIGPFGTFDYVIDGPPLGHLEFSWAFTIARPGGFVTGADLFDLNELGFVAAATVFRDFQGTRSQFFTASDDVTLVPTTVPEPGSLLLGTGLVAAWRAKRRHTSC